MKYIRFLKPPKIDDHKITTLISITSDLGESFLSTTTAITALLCSCACENEIYCKRDYIWRNGMRSLFISLELKNKVKWPVRLQICTTHHLELNCGGADDSELGLPTVVSAWSDTLDPFNDKHQSSRLLERRFLTIENCTLRIWEESGESIARHIWDAGVALIAYMGRTIVLRQSGLPFLERILKNTLLKPLNIIELGTGCGIAGIGLAQMVPNAEVILTDLPDAEVMVLKNISSMPLDDSKRVSFINLDWGFPLPELIVGRSFDAVLITDCTYNPDSSPALVATLTALTNKSPKAIVVLAMKVRHSSEAIFFDLMRDAGFTITGRHVIPLPNDEDFSDDETIELYTFQVTAASETVTR